MAQTPAGPHPTTALAVELNALGCELARCGDQIDSERDEAASALVRAARQLVGRASAPVDRDVLSLLRVTAACAAAPAAEPPDMADVAAAMTLIAKTTAGRAGAGEARLGGDAAFSHVQATLAQIAAAEQPSQGSSRSADMSSVDDA